MKTEIAQDCHVMNEYGENTVCNCLVFLYQFNIRACCVWKLSLRTITEISNTKLEPTIIWEK